MPAPTEILAGLSQIAKVAFPAAVAWHVVVAGLLTALLLGVRFTARWMGLVVVAPIVSAAVFAGFFGNPFNAIALGVLALALGVMSAIASDTPIKLARDWKGRLGGAVLLFAWIYPHFLEDRHWSAYLYGAPLGLIPCPTLSLCIGLALLTDLPSRPFRIVLSAWGLFYSLFGMVRLGVWLDVGLLMASITLIVLPFRPRR